MRNMTHLTPENTNGIVDLNLAVSFAFPKAGLCPYTGLSRSKLNQLILPCEQNDFKPPVKSVCLRQRGAIKGTRLIVLDSLLDYLYSQIDGGEQ
jgi:hypothetical protein